MYKVLKTYRKVVMIVLGIVLMVAFLIGDTIRSFAGDRYGHPGFHGDGVTFSGRDVALANLKVESLKKTIPQVYDRGIGNSVVNIRFNERGGADRGKGEHWLMLIHEARKAGLLGAPANGSTLIEQIAMGEAERYRQSLEQLPENSTKSPEALARIESGYQQYKTLVRNNLEAVHASNNLRVGGDEIAAEVMAMESLLNSYMSGPVMGEQRLYEQMGYQLNRAVFRYLWLPVDDKAIAAIPEPTDADLQTFFEQYREVDALESANGVGYLMEPRVKVQWLMLDAAAIRGQIKIRAVDVENWALRNPPIGGESEEQHRLRGNLELTNQRFREVMDRAQGVVRGEILRVVESLQIDRDGAQTYKRIPLDWDQTRPDFNKIGELVARELAKPDRAGVSVRIKAPQAVTYPDWVTARLANNAGPLGQAKITTSTGAIDLRAMIGAVREIAPEPPSLTVQLNIPYAEPMIDSAGNAFFVVFTDGRKKSGPDSLIDVKAKVAGDYKRVKAYDSLAAASDAMVSQATLDGLEFFSATQRINGVAPKVSVNCYTSRSMAGEMRTPVLPFDAYNPFMNSVKDFADSIVTRAEALDPTKPMNAQKVSDRYFAIKSPKAGPTTSPGIAIIELVGFEPLTREKVERLASGRRSGSELQEMLAGTSTTQGTGNIVQALRERKADVPQGDNPFSRQRQIKRLKVTDLTGGEG